MIEQRLSPQELPVFNTFVKYRMPKHLDIQSKCGDLSMLSDLPNLGLAIVGSRYPQKRSLELVEQVLNELRNTQIIIISGFARGIDAHAHEVALQLGLRTIAILGSGIGKDYPKENSSLRNKILEGNGLMISPYERDAPPLARHFYERNGMIAGFSKATWVVEAAEVSGTLNTANWASKMDRDLYATSCFPGDPFYRGNQKLLSQKDTHRYPVAEALFHAESLAKSWPELGSPHSTQGLLPLNQTPKTELQKWVLEIQSEFGECPPQALMNHAYLEGRTLGEFYLELEKELKAGYLRQDQDGKIIAVL